MKTIKYLSLLFCAILLAQCGSKDYMIPRATRYTVTTEPATKISTTSATLSFTIGYDSGEGYKRSGFFLNSDLSEAKTIYTDVEFSHASQDNVVATDLSPKTKYYYQAFIEDRLGNQIKGETLSFTTARELITVTTLAAKNIGSTTANIYLCATPSQEPAEFLEAGFRVDDKANMSNPVSGVAGGTWPNYDIEVIELTPNTTYYYQGYVKEKDGERIYGNILSFTTLPETVSLWGKVPDSKQPNDNHGYAVGYSTQNTIYVMQNDRFQKYTIDQHKWEDMKMFGVYPVACAPYHGSGIFITKQSPDAKSMQLWQLRDQTQPVLLTDLPFVVTSTVQSLFVCGKNIYIIDQNLTIWEYDYGQSVLHRLSKYPGQGTEGLSGFASYASYSDKIIYGLGWTQNDWCNDLWEYDTRTYKWKALKDFPGSMNSLPFDKWLSFTLGDNDPKGYFITHATSINSNKQNSWTYDVAKNDWAAINDNANFPSYDVQGLFFGQGAYVLSGGTIWKFNPPLKNYGRAPKFRGQ